MMRKFFEIKRFIQRLKRGAVKKSLVASLIVALFALAVFAGVGWYFAFKAVWAYAVAFVVVGLAAFPRGVLSKGLRSSCSYDGKDTFFREFNRFNK